MNDIQYFAKKKGSPEPVKPIGWSTGKPLSVPVKGLLHYKSSNYYPMIEFDLYYRRHPGRRKEARAFLLGYARVSGIKRTRKRQIQKAKFMDHGSYEWPQYWRKPYGKFRRNATRYSKKAGK